MEATEGMREAYLAAWGHSGCSIKAGIEAVLAIVGRERAAIQGGASRMTPEDVPGEAIDAFHVAWHRAHTAPDAAPGAGRRAGIAAALTALQEVAEKERRSAYQGEMTWDPPKLMTLELENVHGVEMMNLGHASRPSEVVTALHTAADDVDAVFLNGGRSE